MHNITDEIIKKRNDDRKNEVLNVNREGKAFRPFLDIFFDLKETVGDEMMPDKTIRDHVNTLILAGHDTIATAVQFTLILIGSYPKVQERLYMELVDIFGDSIRDVEKDDLTRLRYLEAVLKESLRFYTIVPIVARDVTKDVDLKNYTLKAGGACLLMLHGVHRLPMWGEDVEEFKPERWLNPATLPKNPNTFLTFSLGKRVCIGKSYAMMSMKTTLAHVLRTYRIKADHTKLELKYEYHYADGCSDIASDTSIAVLETSYCKKVARTSKIVRPEFPLAGAIPQAGTVFLLASPWVTKPTKPLRHAKPLNQREGEPGPVK
ncbi:unnamed protein product, partial [Iphiclides podalirius]